MKAAKILAGTLGVCITMPIWFYLLYRILLAIHATEVMWLLYWVYVPVAAFVNILYKIVEQTD